MTPVRLMTLNPGHFHAALVQKEMYDGVSPLVHVYASLGPDLFAHLNRLHGFNSRRDNPTAWDIEVHACSNPLKRLLADPPGNVVVLSGRNRTKVHAIKDAVEAGLHVLADKPWILSEDDLPTLQSALETAEARKLIAYDIMTERFEITSMLQRAFVSDPDIFGEPIPGSPEEPGVFMESVHYLAKQVAGVPLRRPVWFFDVNEQGEGLTDVGTHLVDLVMWILFPEKSIDQTRDVRILSARRWPTTLGREDFLRVTGESDFPPALARNVREGRLDYFCNTLVTYSVRGVHVKLNVLWGFSAPAGGGDTHFAVFRGSRSRVEVRQGPEQDFRPELFVVPSSEGGGVLTATRHRIQLLQPQFPGVEVADLRGELHVTIPEIYRVGHEAHFGEVTRQFLQYVSGEATLPAWEKPNMIAKYATTTQGVALARRPLPLSPLGEGTVSPKR